MSTATNEDHRRKLAELMELCRWSFEVWMNELDRCRVYKEIMGEGGRSVNSISVNNDTSAVDEPPRLGFDLLTDNLPLAGDVAPKQLHQLSYLSRRDEQHPTRRFLLASNSPLFSEKHHQRIGELDSAEHGDGDQQDFRLATMVARWIARPRKGGNGTCAVESSSSLRDAHRRFRALDSDYEY